MDLELSTEEVLSGNRQAGAQGGLSVGVLWLILVYMLLVPKGVSFTVELILSTV